MKTLIKNFLREEEGATMVEYGILAALISVVAIVAIGGIGGRVSDAFNAINTKLQTAVLN